MSDFGCYTGKEFLGLKLKPKKFIIDHILKERDNVIIVADPKVGKSILTFQMACSMTCGHPFLGEFNVDRPYRVSIVQLEGDLEESQSRFKRMTKVVDVEEDYLQFIYSPPIELETHPGYECLMAHLEKHKPEIIIIDPIYACVGGELANEKVVRQFVGNMRKIKEHFGCAIILVHHTKRSQFFNGKKIKLGEESLFGSTFFKAYIDHLFMFEIDLTTQTRKLSCETQRSGSIIKEIYMNIIGKHRADDPLHYELISMNEKVEMSKLSKKLIHLLSMEEHREGLTINQIFKKLKITKNPFYEAVEKPLSTGVVVKSSTRPTIYRLGNI